MSTAAKKQRKHKQATLCAAMKIKAMKKEVFQTWVDKVLLQKRYDELEQINNRNVEMLSESIALYRSECLALRRQVVNMGGTPVQPA